MIEISVPVFVRETAQRVMESRPIVNESSELRTAVTDVWYVV
jgi:hypothetical protein